MSHFPVVLARSSRRKSLFGFFCVFMIGSNAGAEPASYEAGEYALFSRTGITLKDRAAIEGMVGSSGTMSLGYDVNISGNILSLSQIAFQDRFNITGSLWTQSDTALARDGIFKGSLVCDGAVSIPERTQIFGNITASSRVDIHQQAVVQGIVRDYTVITQEWIAPKEPQFEFAPGITSIVVDYRESRVLQPGAYSGMTLRSGSTLTLSTGEYQFSQASIQTDVTFDIDDTDGPVIVQIDSGAFVGDRTRFNLRSQAASGFMMRVNGSLSLGHECQFRGAMYSAQNITLGDRFVFHGSIYASGSITTGYDNSIVFQEVTDESAPVEVKVVRWREIGVDSDR